MLIYQVTILTDWNLNKEGTDYIDAGSCRDDLLTPRACYATPGMAMEAIGRAADAWYAEARDCGQLSCYPEVEWPELQVDWTAHPTHPREETGGAFQHGETPIYPTLKATVHGCTDEQFAAYIFPVTVEGVSISPDLRTLVA